LLPLTDLDLTNGAHGEIVDIVLDPDEPSVEDVPIVFAKLAGVHFSEVGSHTGYQLEWTGTGDGYN
jgi:hypothetical protein